MTNADGSIVIEVAEVYVAGGVVLGIITVPRIEGRSSAVDRRAGCRHGDGVRTFVVAVTIPGYAKSVPGHRAGLV